MGQCSGQASANFLVHILAIPSLPHAPARLSVTVRETRLWVQLWAYPESFHILTGLSSTDITQQQYRQGPSRGLHLAKRPCHEELEAQVLLLLYQDSCCSLGWGCPSTCKGQAVQAQEASDTAAVHGSRLSACPGGEGLHPCIPLLLGHGLRHSLGSDTEV